MKITKVADGVYKSENGYTISREVKANTEFGGFYYVWNVFKNGVFVRDFELLKSAKEYINAL